MKDIKFNCSLEPEDKRNFMEVIDTGNGVCFWVEHASYLFRDRVRWALRYIFKGTGENDIILSREDAISLTNWLNMWTERAYDEILKEYEEKEEE